VGLASSAPGLLEVVPQGVLLTLPYGLTLVVLALQPLHDSPRIALRCPSTNGLQASVELKSPCRVDFFA